MQKIFQWLSVDPETRKASLDARNPEFFQNPNRTYAALHSLGPMFWWEEQGQWYFIGYDQVNGLLRDRRFGRQITHVASREELGLEPPKAHLADFDRAESKSLLELEPPEHTRLRTLINRAFVSRQIEQLKPDIAGLAHRLIDGFEKDGKVELLSAFAEIIPVTIIARMLGIADSMGRQLLDWSHHYVRMYMFGRTVEDEYRANRAAREFAEFVGDEIAARRRQPGDDLLSHMIFTERGGQQLTTDELVSTTIVLLNAGHEATVHQIGNAVNTILTNADDAAGLFSDATKTARCVEECLRITAPVHIFERWVLDDLEYQGVTFKKGDKIGLILAAANLDPAKFSDPLAFQPGRNDVANLSFGAGIHFCIGAPLARFELQTVLPILFERLPGLRLAVKPTVKDVYHFHGLDNLQLEWRP